MTKIELPFEIKAAWLRKVVLIFVIGWMASYSIYQSYYKAYGVDTYARYLEHRAGRSMFYNPWQYRMLCPVLIEGIYIAMDNTIYPLMNIKGIDVPVQGDMTGKNENTVKLMAQLKDPVFIKHTFVFLGFRFLE